MFTANSSGQDLIHHSYAVGALAKIIVLKLTQDEKLGHTAYVTGTQHDSGKLDCNYQSWVEKEHKRKFREYIPEEGEHIEKGKFSFGKYPRHNEISLLLTILNMSEESSIINKNNKKRMLHAIYWSHAKPIRKKDFVNVASIYNKFKERSEESIEELNAKFRTFIEELDKLEPSAGIKDLFNNDDIKERIADLRENNLPKFKTYFDSNEDLESYQKDIKNNSKNNIVRSAVISADRIISAMTAKRLEEIVEKKEFERVFNELIEIDSDLKSQMEKCIQGFNEKYPESERNEKQNVTSDRLAELSNDVSVLSGAAGVGKTKIAIEWAIKTGVKKLFWICPRVAICQSIFNDLKQGEYLPNTKVEISTGEFQITSKDGIDYETQHVFSGDIVITTVDQIISSIITHRDITKFVDFMSSHVVFDEFHEYINMSGFNLLFAELINSKKMSPKSNTLLVSATPNHYFVDKFLEIDVSNIVTIESFNNSDYMLQSVYFDEEQITDANPFYKVQEEGSISISNTANLAQNSFIDRQHEENALLYHSKYTKQDKMNYFNEMIDSFKRDGSKKYDSLRSGPGVSASLNITSKRMLSEFNNAENELQRLGRLGRFGENDFVNVMTVAVPKDVKENKKNGKSVKFLNKMHIFNSASAWHHFAQEHVYGKTMKLKEIYQLYAKFYEDEGNKKMVHEDLLKSLKESTKNIDKNIVDPIFVPRRGKSEDATIKIKKHSLRGDNRFAQMAVCFVNDRFSKEGVDILNEYAYNEGSVDNGLTLSCMKILGYGKSEQNLLIFMMKKHHNIKEGFAKAYNDNHLLNMARDPETPIYASYTPDDLEKVNSEPHPFSIYYIKTAKQNVGAMGINILQP